MLSEVRLTTVWAVRRPEEAMERMSLRDDI
jgi:hypothetical protein